MSTDAASVVIDTGSAITKAGLSGEEAPSVMLPTVLGRPRSETQGVYIGAEAQAKRDILDLSYPVSRGHFTNWDDVEQIWRHIYDNELHLSPTAQPLLMSVSPSFTTEEFEKMGQILFESFQVPSLYFEMSSKLSMFGAGATSGIVLEIGEGVTHAVPIIEGAELTHAIRRVDFGGHDVTEYLRKSLADRGHDLDFSTVQDIKEKLAYVALAGESEPYYNHYIKRTYELPDGTVIDVENERFMCAETLFYPPWAGSDQPGVHTAMYDSIMKCEVDVRRTFYHSMYVAGASSQLDQITDRVNKEMRSLGPDCHMRCFRCPEPKFSAWYGGSILASLSTMESFWLKKAEYEEAGASIFSRQTKYR